MSRLATTIRRVFLDTLAGPPEWSVPRAAELSTHDLKYLLDKSGAAPRGLAIDLGCGEGWNAAKLGLLGWHVVGVDISRSAIYWARQHVECKAVDCQFVRGDVTKLSRLNLPAPFDLALDHACYLNLRQSQRQTYVEEVARVVRPDGRLLVLVLSAGARRCADAETEEPEFFRPYFDRLGSWARPGLCQGPAAFMALRRTEAAA